VFFEKDVEWYASNRDLPQPGFCELKLYTCWKDVLPEVRRELASADVAMVGSYFPDGIAAMEAMLDSTAAVRTFYDIDTPITAATLGERGATDYIRADQLPESMSTSASPADRCWESWRSLRGSPRRAALLQLRSRTLSHLSEIAALCMRHELHGTYAPDRQPKLDEFFFGAASALPEEQFIVAGPQYPPMSAFRAMSGTLFISIRAGILHLYSSSRLTLNVTRRDMVMAGYSPSVRLFEAAACGASSSATIGPGLDSFFEPGREILLPGAPKRSCATFANSTSRKLRAIGLAAQRRVLAAHTSQQRAIEFERESGSRAPPWPHFTRQRRAPELSNVRE